jgi:phosphoketolase
MQETSLEFSLTSRELDLIDRYWQAANYLSVGQIYLLGNALLREPLRAEHIKPRLLGRWGTTPGAEFHLRPSRSLNPRPRSRARRERDRLRRFPRQPAIYQESET